MKVNEMLEIVLNCIPIDNGFLNPDTGEIFTEEELLKIEGDLDKAIDDIGIKALECSQRKDAKKELASHYNKQAQIEENREERLKFYLGYLTQGKKTTCKHVSISFYGKQERLGWLNKKGLPDIWKKDSVSRVPDEKRIREALENGDTSVLAFAYIDKRKKATVR